MGIEASFLRLKNLGIYMRLFFRLSEAGTYCLKHASLL